MKEAEDNFARFLAAYPAEKRKGGAAVRALFDEALETVPFVKLLGALTQHKRSVQWREPRYIPSIVTWLREERWVQELPEPKPDPSRLTPWQQARRLGLK